MLIDKISTQDNYYPDYYARDKLQLIWDNPGHKTHSTEEYSSNASRTWESLTSSFHHFHIVKDGNISLTLSYQITRCANSNRGELEDTALPCRL